MKPGSRSILNAIGLTIAGWILLMLPAVIFQDVIFRDNILLHWSIYMFACAAIAATIVGICLRIWSRQHAGNLGLLGNTTELYRSMVENINCGVIVSHDDRIIEVNRAAAVYLGYTPGELTGRVFSQIVFPQSIQALRDHPQRPHKVTLKTRDGGRFAAELHGERVSDGDSSTIIYTILDITGYKEIEEELRAKAELLELSSDTISVYDFIGNPVYLNDAYCQAHGYIREELMRINISQLTTPEVFERIANGFTRISETGNIVFENEHIRKDGSTFTLELHSRVFTWGGRDLFLSIGRDITERKRTDELLESVSLNSPVGMFISQHGKMLFVNDRFCQDTGYSREEILAMDGGLLVHPDDRQTVQKCYIDMLKGSRKYPFEFRGVNKDGSLQWVLSTVTSIKYRGSKAILATAVNITEWKKAEQSLRDSEERFRRLAENAQDLIYLYRLVPEPGFEYVSPAATAITGYSPEEHYADPMLGYKLVAAEDRHLLEDITSSPGDYLGKSVVLRWVRKDGRVIWTEQRNVPIMDRSGKLIAVEGIARDITDRKNAENILRTSETNFRNSISQLPNGVQIVDLTGRTIFVNQSLLDIYGYESLEEFLSVPREERYTPESYAEYRKRRELREKGLMVSYEFEMSVIRKDGQIRHLFSHRNEISWDGNPCYIIIYEDITQRKQAEIALRESQERFIEMANLLPQSVWETDASSKFIFWNEIGRKMHGYDEGDTVITPQVLFAPGSEDQVAEILDTLYSGRSVKGIEAMGLRKDGSSFPVLMYCTPVVKAGIIVGARGITIDLTERKKAEMQERELEVLKQLDILRSELLANVSHELRTPLVAIKGFASTLLRKDASWTEEQRVEFLETIDHEADRLTRLISDLLDMSRLDAGAMPLKRLRRGISEILDPVLPRLFAIAENHELIVKVPESSPALDVDEIRIGQVITNLVDNAVKFSPDKSPITLSVDVQSEEIIFSVQDRGLGIREDSVPHVFDRFFQVESSSSSRRIGSGLGLAICKGIIENHGGQIWVKSQLGAGSTFYFSLPITTQSQ